MGTDPKTSVVTRYRQSHDVDNLLIADGSVLVTDAGFNPSLTIQAVAYGSADYIQKQWQGGAWRNGKRGRLFALTLCGSSKEKLHDRRQATHTCSMARHLRIRLPQRHVGDRIAEFDGKTEAQQITSWRVFYVQFGRPDRGFHSGGPDDGRVRHETCGLSGLFLVAIAFWGLGVVGTSKSLYAMAFVLGLGGSMVVAGENTAISLVNSTQREIAANLLNLFFGVGAFVAPFLVMPVLKRRGFSGV